jgi:hypothetical protein
MEPEIINGKKYSWIIPTQEDIKNLIEIGQDFYFQYRGNDYFVESGGSGYLIQDPRINIKGGSDPDLDYIDYPGHEKAKTPEEFIALPFLDGKTIFERFDELKFFDVCWSFFG